MKTQVKRKILFIDNDDLHQAEQDIKVLVKGILKEMFLMDETDYEITVMSSFGHYLQDDPELMGWKIFDWIKKGGFICTYSMYMGSMTGSDSYEQIQDFFIQAGQIGIKGAVYLDTSGNLPRRMETLFMSSDELEFFIECLDNNFILTYDSYDDKPKRIMFKDGGIGADMFELIDFDMSTIL